MKGFLISLLAAGTALLLASLFWPGASSPSFTRPHAARPIAASVDTNDLEPMHERAGDPAGSSSRISVLSKGRRRFHSTPIMRPPRRTGLRIMHR